MRNTGNFVINSNYEVQVRGPFDARMVTGLKSDLTDRTQWTVPAMYAGMLVSVNADTPENNGVYMLKPNTTNSLLWFTNEDSWVKLFDESEFADFQAKLEQDLSNYVTQDQISGFANIVIGELPQTGEENTIYFTELDGNWYEYIWYNSQFITVGSNAGRFDDYYTKEEIDAKLSAIEAEIPDVSQFITASVDNLVNYYTKTEVDNLIGSISQISFRRVDSLPEAGETNVIYLVPKTDAEAQNGFDEFIWVDNAWEKIGSTDINLDGYITDADLTERLSAYALKTDLPTSLSQLTNDTGFITISDVEAELNGYATTAYVSEQIANVTTVLDSKANISDLDNYATVEYVTGAMANKQDLLVSGTNIKTINGQSILGEGDIEIQGGGVGVVPVATADAVGGILATDSGENTDVSAYVDVEADGKAFVKIPSVDETSTQQDVVDLLNSDSLILNGNGD